MINSISSKVVLVSIIEGSISEDIKQGVIDYLKEDTLYSQIKCPLISSYPVYVYFDEKKLLIIPFLNGFGEMIPFIMLAEMTLAYLRNSEIVASCLILPEDRLHFKYIMRVPNNIKVETEETSESPAQSESESSKKVVKKKLNECYDVNIQISEKLRTSIPSTPNQINLALWDENELKAMIDYDEIKSYVI